MHLNTPNSSDGTQTHVSLSDCLIRETNNSRYYIADNSSFLNVCTWPMTWPMTHAEEESMWLSSTCCVPTHPLPRQGVQGGEVSRTV